MQKSNLYSYFVLKFKKFINHSDVLFILLFLSILGYDVSAQDRDHLKRSVEWIESVELEISSETAHYKPIFGEGDENADMVKGVNRYGILTIEPNSNSSTVDYGREELIYYVLEGTGTFQYDGNEVPVSKDDFFYVPINTEHGFLNPRENELVIMTMGYGIPDDVEVREDSKVEIASGNSVKFQTLEQNNHGPTSRFQLLMGTTQSRRDRIAAAYQVNSLYVIEFDHGGTNIPHRHEREEEIYFVLQGKGDMVAGETAEGEPKRYPVKPEDAFFFSRNSLVGFYSGTEEGEELARILAIRSKYPTE